MTDQANNGNESLSGERIGDNSFEDICVSVLEMEKLGDNLFYKEVDPPSIYNYARLCIIQDHFLSIQAGRSDGDRERSIISGFYIKDGSEILEVISKLLYLSKIFPQIVRIPSVDIIL